MRIVDSDAEVESLAWKYVELLGLPADDVWLTTSRSTFESWLGRRVSAGVGGAYVFLPRQSAHAILINLVRIDRAQPRAVEVVVCEEFLHLKHWLDGDRRRHARHGYDRIAVQVSELTGVSMDEVRGCLRPVQRRPYKYRYECPTCGRAVLRRRRGTWSCGLCSPNFSRKHVLVLREVLTRTDPELLHLEVER